MTVHLCSSAGPVWCPLSRQLWVCVRSCALPLTGRSCTLDPERQEALIQERRRASVRCAVTTPLDIITESGLVRGAKLSSREAFKVTSLFYTQSCCSEYQQRCDVAANNHRFVNIHINRLQVLYCSYSTKQKWISCHLHWWCGGILLYKASTK